MDENLNYLLDTNVLSELRKQARCDANMKQWFSSMASKQMFTSVLVIDELLDDLDTHVTTYTDNVLEE